MSTMRVQRFIRQGIPRPEAELLDQAIALARQEQQITATLDYTASSAVRRNVFARTDQTYRDYHRKVVAELTRINHHQLAFGDVPDVAREEHAAFCYLMFRGLQVRFLDRNPEETAEEFLDKPRKATMNVTALVIHILSKLYHKAPQREFDATTPERHQDALNAMWKHPLWNLTMLEADRYARLVGTVAIRPFFDPKLPGKIRPWLFLSHQLRVIPNPQRPWEAAAVVERVRPFSKKSRIMIWTAASLITLEGSKATYEPHSLGRLPHVFLKDGMSFTSFFVEGRGRMVCDPNVILNNGLTDLEEVKQLQGFSTLEVVNPVEDRIRVGPRQAFVFKPKTKEEPFGLRYVSPGAPLTELRADLSAQIDDIFRQNRIPQAAVGIALGRTVASGVAIRESMRPITDDLEERASLWGPVEVDLADSALRVLRENTGYDYQPATEAPAFTVKYQPIEFPLTVGEEVKRDEFEIATGQSTPAQKMRTKEPDRFDTPESAVAQWHENLDEMASAGFEKDPDDPALQASYGDPEGNGNGTATLDMLEGAGLMKHHGLPDGYAFPKPPQPVPTATPRRM